MDKKISFRSAPTRRRLSTKMTQCATAAAIWFCAATAQAGMVALCGAELSLPAEWKVETTDGQQLLMPPEQPKKGLQRKIHLVRVKDQQVSSLQSASDAETASIVARGQNWQGEGYRKSYRGSKTVTTKSGLEGLRSDFGEDSSGTPRYHIIKYYFRNADGEIFKVCAHVYGPQATLEEFDQLIRDGLRLEHAVN